MIDRPKVAHDGLGNCHNEAVVNAMWPRNDFIWEECSNHDAVRGECAECPGCLACELEEFGREK